MEQQYKNLLEYLKDHKIQIIKWGDKDVNKYRIIGEYMKSKKTGKFLKRRKYYSVNSTNFWKYTTKKLKKDKNIIIDEINKRYRPEKKIKERYLEISKAFKNALPLELLKIGTNELNEAVEKYHKWSQASIVYTKQTYKEYVNNRIKDSIINIKEFIEKISDTYITKRYQINFSFSYVFCKEIPDPLEEKKESDYFTGKTKNLDIKPIKLYFISHSSIDQVKKKYFDDYIQIKKKSDIKNLILDKITYQSIINKVERPDSKTTIKYILGMKIKIIHSKKYIGAKMIIAKNMKSNNYIYTFPDVESNLCLFYCLTAYNKLKNKEKFFQNRINNESKQFDK
jgi:hypothetical protein